MVQTGRMAQATQNIITLKGSTKIVTEFFAYAVNRQDAYSDTSEHIFIYIFNGDMLIVPYLPPSWMTVDTSEKHY
jgi:hypothetical protein